MKTKLLFNKKISFFAVLLLMLCANVTLGQNLMLNPTCQEEPDNSDNADAYDMTPNNDLADGSESPYQAIWDNDPLEDWLEDFFFPPNGASIDEQPSSTSDGNNGTRGIKLTDDGNPVLFGGTGSSRRIYQKVVNLTIGADYTFSVESRSEAMNTPSEVYMLNSEIADELGINANGGSDSSVDGFMMITNDFDSWISNSLTFTATSDFVVVYIRSLGSINDDTEVFYDNFSLVAEGSGGTTPATSGQVIGEFPEMDGGMEDQTATTGMSSAGSSQAGTPQTEWTVSSQGNSSVREITDDAALARTGSFSAAWAVASGANNVRMQSPSPTMPMFQTETDYIIQFFYRAPTDPGNDLDGGIYMNNTSSGDAGNTTDVTAFAPNTWTKTFRQETTQAMSNPSQWGVARLDGDDNGYLDTVRIDDFVVYAGTALDETAPNAATSGTYDTSGNVGWTAPAGGVDGGGYVVFKYTTEPNADNDPNQNGIYEFGNTTTNGTGGLTGTVAFIGTDTNFTDTYAAGNFYKIYAVDKAFNYSDELVISDVTLGVSENVSLDFRLYPNPVKNVLNIETNNRNIDKIEIYDVLGKNVITQNKLENNSINISSLNKGMYFIKILADGQSITRKIIKE